MNWGKLRLKTLALELPVGRTATQVRVTAAGKELPATLDVQGRRAEIRLERELLIEQGQSIVAVLT